MEIFANNRPPLTTVLVDILMKATVRERVLSHGISSFTVRTFSLELSSSPSLTRDGKIMLRLMRFGLKNLSLFQTVNRQLPGKITFQYEKGLHLQEQMLVFFLYMRA